MRHISIFREQLSFSTLDEERLYFFGPMQSEGRTEPGNTMPTGIYRIVDGLLYQVFTITRT